MLGSGCIGWQAPNEESGDVNNDGELTSGDALVLLQFAAGLIEESNLNCGP
ncbi:MAG: hypothetical protein J4N95_08710 [Chloroflexi bacterium]|nr:hypothetical protein [Chloroflexota bacterium]